MSRKSLVFLVGRKLKDLWRAVDDSIKEREKYTHPPEKKEREKRKRKEKKKSYPRGLCHSSPSLTPSDDAVDVGTGLFIFIKLFSSFWGGKLYLMASTFFFFLNLAL